MSGTCSRCGAPGITYGREGFCGMCRLKEAARLRAIHEEAQLEQIARENAKARHPAGRGLRQHSWQLWQQRPHDFGGHEETA